LSVDKYIRITNGQRLAVLEFELTYDCRIPLIGDTFLPSDDIYCSHGQWYISQQSYIYLKQKGFVWMNMPE